MQTHPKSCLNYKHSFFRYSYGYQQWSISFSRSDKALGVYLVWRNPSDGMRVFVDFSITLLNREHFTENQTFATQKAKFTRDAQCKSSHPPHNDTFSCVSFYILTYQSFHEFWYNKCHLLVSSRKIEHCDTIFIKQKIAIISNATAYEELKVSICKQL